MILYELWRIFFNFFLCLPHLNFFLFEGLNKLLLGFLLLARFFRFLCAGGKGIYVIEELVGLLLVKTDFQLLELISNLGDLCEVTIFNF